jgi:serine/threonine protein kinase
VLVRPLVVRWLPPPPARERAAPFLRAPRRPGPCRRPSPAPRSLGAAAALLADVAAGLAELHARGIPHNSLTPGCCLLEGPGWRGLLDLPLPPPFVQSAGLEGAQGRLYPVDYRCAACWGPAG